MTRRRLIFLLMLLFPVISGGAEESLVVIGHPGLPKVDGTALQRLYTGRTTTLGDVAATPLNLPVGNPTRQQFLDAVLRQSEEQYTAYWLVRRYVGKGAPPQEVASLEEAVKLVNSLPGAVAYVPLANVPAGANVLFRR